MTGWKALFYILLFMIIGAVGFATAVAWYYDLPGCLVCFGR